MLAFVAAGALSGGAAAAPARGRRATPAPPKPLRFTCAEALSDGTLTDARLGPTLLALAAGLPWASESDEGPPAACHEEVRLVCGPDLDGDGDAEAIVEVRWWRPFEGGTCEGIRRANDPYAVVTSTFLVSRHGATWRARAPLGVAGGDDPRATGAAYFVRRPRAGAPAIRVEWSSVASDNGCEIRGYATYAFTAARGLKKLETGDASPPCTPCCERPGAY